MVKKIVLENQRAKELLFIHLFIFYSPLKQLYSWGLGSATVPNFLDTRNTTYNILPMTLKNNIQNMIAFIYI